MVKITDILSKAEAITLTAKVCHVLAFWRLDPTLKLPKNVIIDRPNIWEYDTPVMVYNGVEVEFDWVTVDGYPIIDNGEIVAYAPTLQIARTILASVHTVDSICTHTYIVKSQRLAFTNEVFSQII